MTAIREDLGIVFELEKLKLQAGQLDESLAGQRRRKLEEMQRLEQACNAQFARAVDPMRWCWCCM